jgi:hypothetical protein
LNQAQRFLNLKKCAKIEIEEFKNRKNYAQTPHTKNLQINFTGLKVLLEKQYHITLIFSMVKILAT